MTRFISTMATVVLAVAVATTSAFAASSDNYGGNSKKEQRQMERLIRDKFPSYIESTMVCIAKRESGLNPRATNWNDQHSTGRGSFGLFQIGHLHAAHQYGVARGLTGGNPYRLYNPRTNVEAAYRLWLSGKRQGNSGLGPWGWGC